jgi:penicillin amidase
VTDATSLPSADPSAAAPATPRRRRRWLRRTLITVAVVVVVGLVLLTTGSIWEVRRSFPQTSGNLTVAGLDDSVRVVRNASGVPDVYASTSHDLFFAQGYVHAQDRFWEMDVRRHITAGRLSEMFGDSQVDTDKFVRTLGWYDTAKQELAMLSPDTRSALQAYSDGVNAYLRDHSGTAVGLEYGILKLSAPGYTIEPWSPVDSLAWLKAMAWDLRTNMEDETYRALAAGEVGQARTNQLYPPYPYAVHQPITAVAPTSTSGRSACTACLPAAVGALAPALRGAASGMQELDRWLGAYRPGIGSNSWAVTGSRSATGQAILANDPHLTPTLPGIWYQMGLHCSPAGQSGGACPYNVSGFTFSGLPGVIIGHNDRIAWGFTNLGPDVSDLYLERVDDATNTYLQGTRRVRLQTRDETIKVAGGAPVTFTVRSTDDGPLISDVSDTDADVGKTAPVGSGAPPRDDGYGVSLMWTALQPGTTGDAILMLDKAQDWADFRAAAGKFEVPSQNLLYADVNGNIGYQAPGRIPVRSKGDGTWPVPGWDPSYRWVGYLRFRDLPSMYDPPSDYIATANNAVVGPTYPHLLTKDWDYGYRSQRIVDVLTASPPMTLAAMQALQFDNRNPMAPTLVPHLLRLCQDLLRSGTSANAVVASGCDQLKSWDFTQPASGAMSEGAAFYNSVWRALLADTFDELSGDVRASGSDRWMTVVTWLLRHPDNWWWDSHSDAGTSVVETRDDILKQALSDGAAQLADEQGSDPAGWSWGRLHTLELTSPTFGDSGIAPLEMLFNRGPVETSGGEAHVNATSWVAYDGFDVTLGPSMRMVVDLSHLNGSRWVNLTGQSGHVFNSHYWDQTPLWATGQTLPWAFTADAVAAAGDQVLTLNPAG